MPESSISEYMRNVVSGVRNSCVTAETNASRRRLKETTPANSEAVAAAPAINPAQATTSATRNGVQAARSGSACGTTSCTGSVANACA